MIDFKNYPPGVPSDLPLTLGAVELITEASRRSQRGKLADYCISIGSQILTSVGVENGYLLQDMTVDVLEQVRAAVFEGSRPLGEKHWLDFLIGYVDGMYQEVTANTQLAAVEK